MKQPDWTGEFPAAITVCDERGTILSMNDRACKSFEAQGGRALLGSSLLDCHPEPARSKLETLLRTGSTNCYTIEKGGVKKLIYQAPWYAAGQYGGLVEISIPLPHELPHFVRDAPPPK